VGRTDGYAHVAAANPYGLVAMRIRGVRYWWAGAGVLMLFVMYAAPVAAVFRQPSTEAPRMTLPNVAFPSFRIPVLKVPKIHPIAPIAAAHQEADRHRPGVLGQARHGFRPEGDARAERSHRDGEP